LPGRKLAEKLFAAVSAARGTLAIEVAHLLLPFVLLAVPIIPYFGS
jgi:hypothetical protein